jgi:hypothetical protein
MNNLLADITIAPNGKFQGIGPLGLVGVASSNAIGTFTGFISSVVGIMTVVAIIWFVFLFISGAISYMTSGGDKAAIETARKRIVNGIVGLVIVFLAVIIIGLIGYLLGVPNILNLPTLIAPLTG